MKNFEKFLNSVNEDLEKIFDNQKEYIFCKKGCAYCCKRGDFPLSELEFKYLKKGWTYLSEKQKEMINQNIEKLKNADRDSYICPFLIDDVCSIYEYRPFVCRTFGALTEDSNSNPSFPFCTTMGLNYSQLYDKERNLLSFKLYDDKKMNSIPRLFRLNNKVIMNLPYAKELNLNFGECKKMIDFLLLP